MAIDTLASIAEKSGCSVSTVSRVLSGKASKYRISEPTVKRVMREVEKANYTPSLLAKGLRAGKTETLGLLIPGIDDTFFSSIASYIITEAKNLGYTVVVVDTQEDEKNEGDGLSALLARNVDGVIAIPCSANNLSMYSRVAAKGIPIVIVDRYFPGQNDLSFVTTDNYRGAVMAVEYLIKNGHRKIACIQGNPDATTCKERVRGYVDTMTRHGLKDEISIAGNEFSILNGYVETNLALSGKEKPTAIFALSNKILLGTVKAAHESGLRIPEDLSVMAFDDNLLYNYLNPSITCIAQPIQDLSILAINLLVKKIAGSGEVSNIFLPPALIKRTSVKKV